MIVQSLYKDTTGLGKRVNDLGLYRCYDDYYDGSPKEEQFLEQHEVSVCLTGFKIEWFAAFLSSFPVNWIGSRRGLEYVSWPT